MSSLALVKKDKKAREIHIDDIRVHIMSKLDALEQDAQDILCQISNIKDNFLVLGRMLYNLNKNYTFSQSEYSGFEEYCSARFDLGRTTVNNLMAVYSVYELGGFFENEPKYKLFNHTQLVETLPLVGLPTSEKITADWPVSKIRAYKRTLKDEANNMEKVVKEKSIDDKIFNFSSKEEIRAFLSAFDTWECISKIPQLSLTVYRCFLSNGRKLIGIRQKVSTKKHYDNLFYETKKEPIFGSWLALETIVKDIEQYELSARLIPFV